MEVFTQRKAIIGCYVSSLTKSKIKHHCKIECDCDKNTSRPSSHFRDPGRGPFQKECVMCACESQYRTVGFLLTD